ncbi:hypothetical protein ACFXEB_06665 [Aerococcus urinaeequi]|uniref:hypothetical protein n=1 Tax=Aerococcus urinaeequi TaxID=51665 RepID=UPI00366B7DF2
MEVNELLTILIGGGGVGAIVAAIMTRQTDMDKNKIDLLDRALQEIARLEAKLKEAEEELDKEQAENYELRKVLADLKEQVSNLRIELRSLKGEDSDGV